VVVPVVPVVPVAPALVAWVVVSVGTAVLPATVAGEELAVLAPARQLSQVRREGLVERVASAALRAAGPMAAQEGPAVQAALVLRVRLTTLRPLPAPAVEVVLGALVVPAARALVG
jgi:hypothetical protein